jgi:hypothetical protein
MCAGGDFQKNARKTRSPIIAWVVTNGCVHQKQCVMGAKKITTDSTEICKPHFPAQTERSFFIAV